MLLVEIADVFLGRAPPKPRAGGTALRAPILALRDVGARIAPREALEEVDLDSDFPALRPTEVGDIVLTARGRPRAALVTDRSAGVLVGANLMLIRITNGLPPPLLLNYLRHPEVERRLLTETAGTSTPGVSAEALRHLQVVMPPRRLWEEAAHLVEAVDRYHDTVVEAVGLFKESVSEWVYQRMTSEDDR